MPLPAHLRDDLLSDACPHCGHRFERTATWFKSVRHFQCDACGQETQLTYAKKVELFENYLRSEAHSVGSQPGRVDAHAIVEADRYRKETTEVAHAWFEAHGHRAPTHQQLRRVACQAQIIAEAKRRLAEKAGLKSTINALDLLSLRL